MKKLVFWLGAFCIGVLCGCSTMGMGRFDPNALSEVYVKDFDSSEPTRCTVRDVDLNHSEAHTFFSSRAKPISYELMNENYPFAPCEIMGTLKYGSVELRCNWSISATMTGSIQCDETTWYFACDDCEDLFRLERAQ